MSDPKTDVRTGLERERRNLILVSSLLVLYVGAKVKLTSVSVLGSAFQLGNPGAVPAALWMFWLYSALRYYQYYRDLEDPGPKAAYHRQMKRHAIAIAKPQLVARLTRGGEELRGQISETVRSADAKRDESGGWDVQADVHVYIPDGQGGGKVLMNSKSSIRVQPETRLRKVQCLLWVAFHTRYFTEYYLPFVVAAVPCVVWLMRTLPRR